MKKLTIEVDGIPDGQAGMVRGKIISFLRKLRPVERFAVCGADGVPKNQCPNPHCRGTDTEMIAFGVSKRGNEWELWLCLTCETMAEFARPATEDGGAVNEWDLVRQWYKVDDDDEQGAEH